MLDATVARLHPRVASAVRRARPAAVLRLRGGERSKSLSGVLAVLVAGRALPRSATLVAVGGGALGDLCVVAAHLLRRGIRLVHVPTTLLSLVDSSVGGKGAVNLVRGAAVAKNAAGAFHYPVESWICTEFLRTLPPRRLREGKVEAWKAAACLDARAWRAWKRRPPGLPALIRRARRTKARACARDPYDAGGRRSALNFGHTFGHAIEALSDFRVPHGEAVALGILCALDVGRAVSVTPRAVAAEVETEFVSRLGAPGRPALARILRSAPAGRLAECLAADKRRGPDGLAMVLLGRIGRAAVVRVDGGVWRALLPGWVGGRRE